jgi:hypothetical protein
MSENNEIDSVYGQPREHSPSQPQPQIIEVNVHYGGDGKVAIEDYGKESSGYSMSLSQRYAIPASWSEEEALAFQMAKVLELKETVEPILQEERDLRMAARVF